MLCLKGKMIFRYWKSRLYNRLSNLIYTCILALWFAITLSTFNGCTNRSRHTLLFGALLGDTLSGDSDEWRKFPPTRISPLEKIFSTRIYHKKLCMRLQVHCHHLSRDKPENYWFIYDSLDDVSRVLKIEYSLKATKSIGWLNLPHFS